MSKKVYRSAQGKSIDIGALQLQNETVRAVGNMGVNARGDKINPLNNSVNSRNNSVNQHYKKQTRNNVTDDIVVDSKKSATLQQTPKKAKAKAQNKVETVPQPVLSTEFEEQLPVEEPTVEAPVEEVKVKKPKPVSGLAGAIAKAKSVEQEPMKTPRQIAQSRSGVKKI